MNQINDDITERYIKAFSKLRKNLMCEIFESENIKYPNISSSNDVNYKNYTSEIDMNKSNNSMDFWTENSWFDLNPIIGEGYSETFNYLSGGGFSGLVTNEKMKLVLSDVDHMNSETLGKNYRLKYNDYHGCCTSGPSTWYGRAGLHMRWWLSGSIKTYKTTVPGLGAGFVPVAHGNSKWIDSLDSKTLRPGDIATLYNGSPGHQHGMMWTGNDWRSDCIQRKAYCYGTNTNPWAVVLWRHPNFQEPNNPVYRMLDA